MNTAETGDVYTTSNALSHLIKPEKNMQQIERDQQTKHEVIVPNIFAVTVISGFIYIRKCKINVIFKNSVHFFSFHGSGVRLKFGS